MLIDRITMNEFSLALEKTKTIILPIGSIEAHGPHLPLGTDTIQAFDTSLRTSKVIDVFVAPPIYYGVCRSTKNHAGTISISGDTLRSLLWDLISSFRSQGLKNFVILSGHAGGTHMAALQEVGERLIEEFSDIQIAVVSELDLLTTEDLSIIETKGDSHAGEMETSRIQYLIPELVKGMAPEEYPRFPKSILVRDKERYWKGVVWGNPEKASIEKGKILTETMVNRLKVLIERIESL